MVSRSKGKILELLFPPRCPVCDRLLDTAEIRKEQRIHRGCEGRIYPVGEWQCLHCGRPLDNGQAEYCFDCSQKQKKDFLSFYVQGKSLFVYQGDIKKTMYRFKYSNRREYALFFAEEVQKRHRDWIVRCGIEAVVPVPMYKKKEKRRGYNQAKLFAEKLAGLLALPYEPDALRRVRDTRPQKELDDAQRKINLKNAFHAADFVVKYNCILLVDDIYTTGCTVENAAETLRNAGVDHIYILTVCIGKGF